MLNNAFAHPHILARDMQNVASYLGLSFVIFFKRYGHRKMGVRQLFRPIFWRKSSFLLPRLSLFLFVFLHIIKSFHSTNTLYFKAVVAMLNNHGRISRGCRVSAKIGPFEARPPHNYTLLHQNDIPGTPVPLFTVQ